MPVAREHLPFSWMRKVPVTKKDSVMEQTTSVTISQNWFTVKEAVAYSGFSRTWIHFAIKNGDVESRSIVRKGVRKGRRLILKESLAKLMVGKEGGSTNGTNA